MCNFHNYWSSFSLTNWGGDCIYAVIVACSVQKVLAIDELQCCRSIPFSTLWFDNLCRILPKFCAYCTPRGCVSLPVKVTQPKSVFLSQFLGCSVPWVVFLGWTEGKWQKCSSTRCCGMGSEVLIFGSRWSLSHWVCLLLSDGTLRRNVFSW